jgi:hypothetical protein
MTTAETHEKSSVPQATRCAACAHVWAEHDTISARYCAATVVGKFERGCVCTTNATVEPPG